MSEHDDNLPEFDAGAIPELDLSDVPAELGILPLRDTLLFPHVILPLAVARERSVALVNDAVSGRKVIGVVTQRDPETEEPQESDLHTVGTLTHIHKMFKFPDGSLRLVVQGVQRFRVLRISQYSPFLKAQVELLTDEIPPDQEVEIKGLAVRSDQAQAVGMQEYPLEISFSPGLPECLPTICPVV